MFIFSHFLTISVFNNIPKKSSSSSLTFLINASMSVFIISTVAVNGIVVLKNVNLLSWELIYAGTSLFEKVMKLKYLSTSKVSIPFFSILILLFPDNIFNVSTDLLSYRLLSSITTNELCCRNALNCLVISSLPTMWTYSLFKYHSITVSMNKFFPVP